MSLKLLLPATTIYAGFARSSGVSPVKSLYSTSPGTHHFEIALLQRSTGRLTADYDRTTSASTKRRGTPGLRVGSKGARHSMSSPTAWVPVRWRIQFKLCRIMHSVFNGKCPAYLSDIVQTVSASRPRLRLRSSSSTDYVLPRLRTKFGERAFSHAGPSAWNRLPEDIRAEPDITNFRKHLKTHYFNSVFNVHHCILSFYL